MWHSNTLDKRSIRSVTKTVLWEATGVRVLSMAEQDHSQWDNTYSICNICNAFSHWLAPCSVIDRNLALVCPQQYYQNTVYSIRSTWLSFKSFIRMIRKVISNSIIYPINFRGFVPQLLPLNNIITMQGKWALVYHEEEFKLPPVLFQFQELIENAIYLYIIFPVTTKHFINSMV